MGEETQSRGLFIYIPNYNTLIVRTTDEGLPILRNREPPNPVLVPGPRALAVPRAYLPKLYSFITGAREHHVPLGVEQDKADVVVMPEKSLEAEIVVVEVPELDGEIRRAAGDIPALVIVADVIDRIYVRQGVLVCPLRVRSKSPVSNSQILMVPSSEEVASCVY